MAHSETSKRTHALRTRWKYANDLSSSKGCAGNVRLPPLAHSADHSGWHLRLLSARYRWNTQHWQVQPSAKPSISRLQWRRRSAC